MPSHWLQNSLAFWGVHGWLNDYEVSRSCGCKTSPHYQTSTTLLTAYQHKHLIPNVWFSTLNMLTEAYRVWDVALAVSLSIAWSDLQVNLLECPRLEILATIEYFPLVNNLSNCRMRDCKLIRNDFITLPRLISSNSCFSKITAHIYIAHIFITRTWLLLTLWSSKGIVRFSSQCLCILAEFFLR